MELKLQSLSDAIARSEEAVERYKAEPEDDIFRDALIQRFEFTYELAFNLMRRQIQRSMSSKEALGALDFMTIIRQAWALGLLQEEVAVWRDFRLKRNLTSHTYDQSNADEVCAVIPRFLAEAKFLYSQLEKRSNAS